MPRKRRPKTALDLALQILPPFAGLFALGWAFSPQFRAIVSGILLFALVLGSVAVVGLIVWAVYRHRTRAQDTVSATSHAASPTFTASPRIAPPVRSTAISTWSLELLRSLEWKRFEELVCAYVRQLGYEARTTRLGADGGVDVEVLDPATQQVAMIVQCKAWNVYPVGIKSVRELYGVMAATKIPQCAFFTSGTYTTEALVFGQKHDVDLVDGEELLSRINQLKLSQSLQLLEDATRGDYTTPTCPSCGVKMILRTAGKGRSAGEDFWGCPSYPRCRQTFKVASS